MVHYGGLFIRDGQYLSYLLGIAGSEDPSETQRETGQAMIDAEPGEGDDTFTEDGCSSGGF
jgi:hypothetical protein